MPFTISHAAAALPIGALSRSRLPLAALMIGSMSPDFAYLLPVEYNRLETHSLVGLFSFCLPLGLALWLCFVTVLERPTLAFLPDAWRSRIPRTVLSPREMIMAAGAIIIGALTHVVWDAFTHSSTPVVETFPGFRDNYLDIGSLRIPVYYVLQIASSVFGLAVLGVWALNIRRRPRLPRDEQVLALVPAVNDFERFLAVMFMGASACAVGFFRVSLFGADVPRSAKLFYLLTGGMIGAGVAWLALAIALRFRSRALRLLAQTDAE
jgi:uncharacterized protein YjeT (DUF2065 family)